MLYTFTRKFFKVRVFGFSKNWDVTGPEMGPRGLDT
jgi:hypothetical protein